MMASVRAEFRKLLTVRSTYIIAGLAFLMMLVFAFYIEGFKAKPEALNNPSLLAGEVISAINAVAGLLALVGLLLMTHEYRYNTIMYTLTASKSRTRTLLAKIIVVSCFALFVSLLVGLLSPTLTYLGVHLHGHTMAAQVIPVGNLLWRCLFFGWGYAMAALLFAALIRNQVGAIVAYFIIPGPLEALMSLLLKNNALYLPFTALMQVTNTATGGEPAGASITRHLSPGKGALVFMAYLVIGWIVAWILFLRRDAN
jgi:ABC-2 type transport system permease protein